MDQSLSIILPVHNAEETLARQVFELLEVLPELTSQFELLIVDDGSTDHTEEVAYDLSRQFPQLRVARHSCPQGAAGAVVTGLSKTSGEILLVHDGRAPLRTGQLRRLWELRKDEQLLMARSRPRSQAGDAIDRLEAWGSALRQAALARDDDAGMHMIRRQAIVHLRPPKARDAG